MKKLSFCLLILISVIALSSCSKRHEKKNDVSEIVESSDVIQKLEGMEEPLVVFYERGASNVLTNFIGKYPDVPIHIYQMDENEEGLMKAISDNGDPDLIIMGGDRSRFLEGWYEEGLIADISEMIYNDSSLDTSTYFPGTFNVGANEKGIYGIPLGISLPMLTVSESKWISSAFAELEEGYTAEELVKAFKKVLTQPREEGEFFCAEPSKGVMEFLVRLGEVKEKENELSIDEELFAELYSIQAKRRELWNETQEYWREKESGFGEGYHFITGLDPRLYEGKYLATNWEVYRSSPQLSLLYATSANQHIWNEDTYALYYPSVDNSAEYGAEVMVFGLVGAYSNHKQEAFDLLRALMDTEIDMLPQPWGYHADAFCPVNKKSAFQMIEDIYELADELEVSDGSGTGSRVNVLFAMQKQNISDREKEKLENVLNGITFMFCQDSLMWEAEDIIYGYYQAEITDYRMCYLEIMQLLNQNNDSWNLSAQEIEEFLNTHQLDESSEIDEQNKPVQETTKEATELKQKLSETEVGQEIMFGEYEQDNDLENGAEEIEWIVLDKTDEKVLLISKYCIEYMQFMPGFVGTEVIESFSGDPEIVAVVERDFSWKKSPIREWLNGDFLQESFSDEERSIILENKNVHTSREVEDTEIAWWVKGVKDSENQRADEITDHYIFILDAKEIEKYLPESEDRIVKGTQYVVGKQEQIEKKSGGISWAMRQPGYSIYMVTQVKEDGTLDLKGTDTVKFLGIRPVLWVDINLDE